MYRQEVLDKYLNDVAANTPVPGGGSVSALVGALGASTASMTANFTLGKERFKRVESQIREILARCKNSREEFLRLMEEDIYAYNGVTEAYALPQSTEEEWEARSSAIQNALEIAIRVPLKVMKIALDMLVNINELVKISNPNLITDAGVAGVLSHAALKGAMLNVEINLSSMKKEEVVCSVKRDVKTIVDKAQILSDAIMEKVNETMNKQA